MDLLVRKPQNGLKMIELLVKSSSQLFVEVNDVPNVIWMDVVNETVLRNGNWFSNLVIHLGKIHGLKLV